MALTRSQYRERALRAADSVGLVDDDEVDTIIQAKVNDLYGMFVQAFEDYNVEISDTLTVATGADYVDLPEDCDKVRAVDILETQSGKWRDMDRFEMSERNDLTSLKYRPVGSQLLIRPADSAPGTQVRLYYVPTAPQFSDDDLETPFDDLGFWEWVVISTAIQVLANQQQSTRDQEAVLTRIETGADGKGGLQAFLQRRDLGKPIIAEDVRRDAKYWNRRGVYPGDDLP